MSEVVKSKKPWLSKTILTNFVVAVVAFFGEKYVVQFPQDTILMFLGALNIILRLVTKDKIGLDA